MRHDDTRRGGMTGGGVEPAAQPGQIRIDWDEAGHTWEATGGSFAGLTGQGVTWYPDAGIQIFAAN